MTVRPGVVTVALLAALAGCSLLGAFDESARESCSPGTTRQAPCGVCGRSLGVQVCALDGFWETRSCDPDPDDTDGDLAAATECMSGIPVDCDDTDGSVHPDAMETCNGTDDDCDGETDEGFGCPSNGTRECTLCSETGVETCAGDCSSWGPCELLPSGGSCWIGDTCFASGAAQPGNPCVVCDPARNTTSWSPAGCWRDDTTGLLWENPPSETNLAWRDAVEYCARLSAAGLTGWDLPTVDELRSFVRGCSETAPGGECGLTDECRALYGCWEENACNGCLRLRGPGSEGCYWDPAVTGPCGVYWSTYAASVAPSFYWTLDFGCAGIWHTDGTLTYFVRCVRAAP